MTTAKREPGSPENTSYPRPKLPMLPTMSLATFAGHTSAEFGSVFVDDRALFLSSGRAALGLALQRLRVGQGDTVLMPAYHCQSMVSPIRWSGATPRFYRINSDLTPDINDIGQLLDDSVRSLIVVHYFGFLQPYDSLRRLCESRGVAIIEDCAHSYVGRCSAPLPGGQSDYAVASTRKFFPAADGGMLFSKADNFDDLKLDSPLWRYQLKGVARVLQKASDADKLGMVSGMLSYAFRALEKPAVKPQRSAASAPESHTSSFGDRHFDQAETRHTGLMISRWLQKRINLDRISEIRRHNYNSYLQKLSHVQNAKPLFASLPDATVPYVFPLVLKYPASDFARLKFLGVPIWRWEDLSTSRCDVSNSYLNSLLQLPCHQELGPEDIEWIVSNIRTVCG